MGYRSIEAFKCYYDSLLTPSFRRSTASSGNPDDAVDRRKLGVNNVRWPTTVTSKPNAHSKLQSAHSKLQSAHIKFKSLTSNSNRSQQIQITHSKLQIAHSKFKSPTANSNRPQQIQIVHSKLKSLTANSNCSHQITNY